MNRDKSYFEDETASRGFSNAIAASTLLLNTCAHFVRLLSYFLFNIYPKLFMLVLKKVSNVLMTVHV